MSPLEKKHDEGFSHKPSRNSLWLRFLMSFLVLLSFGLTVGTTVVQAQPFAYVANCLSNNVSVIDATSNTVVATVSVGVSPVGVAITPNGTFAYVANLNSGNVSVINTTTNTVVSTILV